MQVADQCSTGSSLMPQKRNPDSLELLRGKAGRLTGNLVSLLVTLKGLPAAYNKDLQEDKEPLFDSVDTLLVALPVAAGVLATLSIRPERMRGGAGRRAAGHRSGRLSGAPRRALPPEPRAGRPGRQAQRGAGRHPAQPALAEYQAISPQFGPDVVAVFDFEQSVEQRAVFGGTAKAACLSADRAPVVATACRGRHEFAGAQALARILAAGRNPGCQFAAQQHGRDEVDDETCDSRHEWLVLSE